MPKIQARDVPDHALIARYRDAGDYTDDFTTTVPGSVSHAAYVETFYTTWLFKLERLVLTLIGKPSTDEEAHDLATGRRDAFAAWTVEALTDNQIVLCDFQGLTRSWLMTVPARTGTTLHFGTAVVTKDRSPTTAATFRALTGLHRLYARALLAAAAGRLRARTKHE